MLQANEPDYTSLAKSKVREVIAAVAKGNDDAVKCLIVTEENSSPRHAASPNNLRLYFKNVTPDALQFGPVTHSKAFQIVNIRLLSPINVDLDFYYDNKSPEKLLLKSVHP
jgi:hypothetical protein